MKPKPSPHDDEIIELLKKLGTLRAEYPSDLLAARRAAFLADVEVRKAVGENKQEISGQDQIVEVLQGLKPLVAEYPSDLLAARRAAFVARVEELKVAEVKKEEIAEQDQIVELLQGLKPLVAEYPSDQLAARRAAFVAQIQQRNQVNGHEELPSADQVIELLESLQPAKTAYPSDLLAARRAAFIAQIEQRNRVSAGVQEAELPSGTGRIQKLFTRLKSVEIEYPLKLWGARRSAFISQIRDGRTSVLDALRSVLRTMFYAKAGNRSATATSFLRTSMIVAGFLMAAFVGALLYGSQQALPGMSGPSLFQREGSHAGPMAATGPAETATVICKPGYLPPLCLAKEFDQSRDLTFPGNGAARPAVAKDTVPGHGRIHKAAYVNDGLYGPGASWVSNSAYSWIKIDLGEARTINTITFGRDRLGKFNDGDPGQFVIAVALSDNVYADGNSSNDFMEYTNVYDSKEVGFDGIVSGPETIEAAFDPVAARYVKITFENARTAVDEIEAFMIQPPGFAGNPTRKPRDDEPLVGFTLAPTTTLIPTTTPTRVPPSSTPVPTDTPSAVPTLTLAPTDTSTPEPTNTPRPTRTHTPEPTNTPRPTRTHTPEPSETPRPTRTPSPEPTDTPRPTTTPEPEPTSTPQPTDTLQPPDTDTPVPTGGAGPAIDSTGTPGVITGP